MSKLIGWGCVFFGGLMIFVFPFTKHNQPPAMTKAGIVFGIIFLGIGLFLIKL